MSQRIRRFPLNIEVSTVFNPWVFVDLRFMSASLPAGSVRFKDEWCSDEMGVAFTQAAYDRYCCDEMKLEKILRITEQAHLIESIREHDDAEAEPSGTRGEENASNEFVESEDRHVAHAQKALQEKLCTWLVTFSQMILSCFSAGSLMFSRSVHEMACNDVLAKAMKKKGHSQAIVQELLEQAASQGFRDGC